MMMMTQHLNCFYAARVFMSVMCSCDAQSKFSVCTDGTSEFIPVEAILAEQGCNAPLWVNTLVLLGFLVVFRLLGYLVLRFVRCPK